MRQTETGLTSFDKRLNSRGVGQYGSSMDQREMQLIDGPVIIAQYLSLLGLWVELVVGFEPYDTDLNARRSIHVEMVCQGEGSVL